MTRELILPFRPPAAPTRNEEGMNHGCGRLCAAACRRARRRLRLGPVRLRDRADGARHLALRPAAVDGGAVGPDLLRHLPNLDAAFDVAGLRSHRSEEHTSELQSRF